MRYRYSEFDGSEFPTLGDAGFFDDLAELILAYGDRATEALDRLKLTPEQRAALEKLFEEGLLEKTGVRWQLTPRAINRMQRRALMEVFTRLKQGGRDGHETAHPGPGGERTDGTRPYEFGDPVSELDPAATLRNAVIRGGPGLPIRVRERDFEIHRSESQADCSTVLLLDLSGSMMRYGRYLHAKKCAMAMHALIRQRFPRDTIDIVGFYSSAAAIPEHKLPLAMPKPVTLFDPVIRLRVPIGKADAAPQHFTNLHLGLIHARRILRRRGGQNRQIFIITDGEPTAHAQGDYLYLIYPPDAATAAATLHEAYAAASDGVRIATFALIDDYFGMDWVGFVDRLTRLTRGVAFYCHGGDLSTCVMESYLSGRKQKAFLA
jgi:Ca-activated chloride channel family protein